MAARIRLHQQDVVRSRIQVTQLLKVLTNHALDDSGAELSTSRLKAIEILLRKSLPDLSAVTISGDEKAAPIQITWQPPQPKP